MDRGGREVGSDCLDDVVARALLSFLEGEDRRMEPTDERDAGPLSRSPSF
jgi:hypothetical protein